MRAIKINHKKIRAEIIKKYLGNRRAFAFSCGNATRWLKRAGVNLIAIDGIELEAKQIIKPEQAEYYFDAFNATSGYLPTFLLERIARRIKEKLPCLLKAEYLVVPFGSGELIAAISFFYPASRIIAVYSNRFPPTGQDGTSPLASFVKTNCGIRPVPDATTIKELLNHASIRFYERKSIFIDTSEAEK